ncbi:MAG: DNA translocase FtsK 4TM domain-containing protein, partial [Pseudomonadota bacterium]
MATYTPDDPCVFFSVTDGGDVHNLFGVLGANVGGLLVGLFGLGAFFLPVLLTLAGLALLRGKSRRRMLIAAVGGGLFMLFSGSFWSLFGNDLWVGQRAYSTGGLLGMGVKNLLVRYLNPSGAGIVLFTFFLLSFMAATGLSLAELARRAWNRRKQAAERVETRVTVWKERRKKLKVRAEREAREKEEGPKTPPKIHRPVPVKPIVVPVTKQKAFEFMGEEEENFGLPSLSLLDDPPPRPAGVDKENLQAMAGQLERKLEDYGISGKVIEVSPGPVITTFEYEPAPGVKISRIMSLADDLAMTLTANSVRIVGAIPGKAALGVEIPNRDRELVCFKEVTGSATFARSKSPLTLCLGKDIVGNPAVADLAKMPHLLIAGATGSGKSVALNAMIASMLYKATPQMVRFIMVDPKRIELSLYDGIPHLICPVVTDVKKATNALFWAVREMERRYEAMAELGVRNLAQYNQKVEKAREAARLKKEELAAAPLPGLDEEGDEDLKAAPIPREVVEEAPLEKLPLIVIIIDELADLMMVASRDVEVALARLAQMARASGIHLILATQRPSVDVLTGTIKANFPTRITFQVSSRIDSRTVIDQNGAEALLGNGDMLYMPPGTSRLVRIHGAFLSEEELGRVLDWVRNQQAPEYDPTVTESGEATAAAPGEEEY